MPLCPSRPSWSRPRAAVWIPTCQPGGRPVAGPARGARARRVRGAGAAGCIDDLTEGRQLGFLGEPRVNVLALNLALDRQFGEPKPVPAPVKAQP